MKKIKKIPTLVGILTLVIGVGAGIFLVQSRQIFNLEASPDTTPQDVRVTNVTDSSFTVSWFTQKQTTGFVAWGENQSLGRVAGDNSITSNAHWITVRNLSANNKYLFKINSEGNDIDNNGIAWEVVTGPGLSITPKSSVISGSVLTASGQPAENVLVYITAGGLTNLSAITSANGSWLITLGTARSSDLSSAAQITQQSPLLEVFAQGGPLGVASAQIFPGSANPVPPILIGQTHDFRNEPISLDNKLPEATFDLPTDSTPSSGFDIPEDTGTTTSSTVTLDSIEEGEIVASQNPEFFGEGPVGTKITITVESTPQEETLTIASSGNWNWSPPDNLPPGNHQITITWNDDNGILRTLKRSFVVQAAEVPAFESTPSATPKPSPSSTPSPTPTPTLPPSLTPAPTPSPVSTISAIPEAGTITPTIGLAMMGLGLVTASFFVWKYSVNSG